MMDTHPRLVRLVDGKLAFDCPGCGMMHAVNVAPQRGRPFWTWNGDMVRPTFAPSLLVTWEWGEERTKKVCHSFVRDGRIQFLGDCTHAHAGRTVDLPPHEDAAANPETEEEDDA